MMDKYWYITYRIKRDHTSGVIRTETIKAPHPIHWALLITDITSDGPYEVLFYEEITENLHKLFQGEDPAD